MSNAFIEDELAEILWDGEPNVTYFARGLVRSFDGSKVGVTVKGSDQIRVAKLAGYAPKVGDVALVLMMPSGGIAIDKIG